MASGILRCRICATESRSTSRDAAPFKGPRHLNAAQTRPIHPPRHTKGSWRATAAHDSLETDTQTDMLLGEPKSAICVQRFDDSLNSAIHTTYRTWLRSSSMHEPRDPPLKVVSFFYSQYVNINAQFQSRVFVCRNKKQTGPEEIDADGTASRFKTDHSDWYRGRCRLQRDTSPFLQDLPFKDVHLPLTVGKVHSVFSTKRNWRIQYSNGNDPSAGSPTETLLRLLLPLNDQV